MALSPRELMNVIRARDEASQVVGRVSEALMQLSRVSAGAAKGLNATGTESKKSEKGLLGLSKSSAQLSLGLFAVGMAAQRAGQAIAGMGATLTGLGVASAKMAADFDTKMRLVQTVARESEKDFEFLKKGVLDLSTKIPLAAGDLADALYDIYSSVNVNAEEAMYWLQQVGMAAVAGATDTRTAMRATIGIMNAYQLSTEDLSHVMDVQFELVNYGVGTYEELVNAMGQILPFARAAGQEFENMAGLYAAATRHGLNAAKAAISLSRAYDLITRPENVDAMKKVLNIDVVDQATGKYKQMTQILKEMATKGLDKMKEPERKRVLAEIFGQGEVRAMRFFNLAIPNWESFNDIVSKTGGNADAMLDAFEEMAEGPAAQITLIWNEIKKLAIELGYTLLPYLKTARIYLQKVTEWFDKLPPSAKRFIAVGLILAGVFFTITGAVLMFIGQIMGTVALLLLAGKTAFIIIGVLGGLGLALLSLAGIVGGVVASILMGWSDSESRLRGIWANIRALYEGFIGGFKSVWDEKGKPVLDELKQAWKDFSTAFTDLIDEMSELVNDFFGVDGPEDLKKFADAVGKELADRVIPILEDVKEWIEEQEQKLKDWKYAIDAFLRSKEWKDLKKDLNELLDAVQDLVEAFGNTKKALEETPKGAKHSEWVKILNMLKNMAQAAEAVVDALTAIIDAITWIKKNSKIILSISWSLPTGGASLIPWLGPRLQKAIEERQHGGPIDYTGLYLLHKGEHVISKEQNQGRVPPFTVNIYGDIRGRDDADYYAEKTVDYMSRKLFPAGA